MINDLISHLKEVQRKLQVEKGYGEVNANNDLVSYYNDNFDKNYDKSLKEIKDAFYHLCLTFRSICSYSNQGHWKSVMNTQIGWFLTIYNKAEVFNDNKEE